MEIKTKLIDLIKEFEIDKDMILEIAYLFKNAIEDGLKGEESPLKMLPSFIVSPSGKECGTYLTVDFGGTNIRTGKLELENGHFKKIGEIINKLKNDEANYDFTTEKTTGEELFDFIAEQIAKLVEPKESVYLGHTFSFPNRQININEAFLIEWTKEIKTSGVIGKNPNNLLNEALKRKNINVVPRAIINDTVGTLLVAAYMNKDTAIGTIMGTGHNSCYIESNHPINDGEMIVNMESGNFNKGLPITKYDFLVDANSINPGGQLLEKMISGYYLGDLVKYIIEDFYENSSLFTDNSHSVNILVNCKIDALMVGNFIMHPGLTVENLGCKLEDAIIIKEIAEVVVRRAVRLTAVTHIGTLFHIDDGDIKKNHIIAIDGSIYEKMPNVPVLLNEAFKEVLEEKSKLISVKFVKDGSGVGAAIAAAIAVNSL